MRILLLYYFLWPYIHPSNAQGKETSMNDLFFKDKIVTWQKTFTGVWDDVIPVQMELLSDGTACKGYFYFGDSKNKYVLSGKMNQNEIILEEQDIHSNKTGQLIIQLEHSQIRGTWYNASKSFNARLSMIEGNNTPEINYWIKSYSSKEKPESMILLHKDFADQINESFYYKPFNKTLFGTSEIKEEESFSQVAQMEDYLHHSAGTLHTWKINDKRIDISYKLGTIEYTQSMDLLQQFPILQETFADHWIAVDMKYPKTDKSNITSWFKNIIDSLQNDIQNKKSDLLIDNKDAAQSDRLTFRMSIWPAFDFLNGQIMSGTMNVKNSWEEATTSIPFIFDLKKGSIIRIEDFVVNIKEFESVKAKWIQQELNKLKTSSSLAYETLHPDDFKSLSIKQEGLAYTAPFDITYGSRQIIIPYPIIKEYLSPKYFPL